MREAAARAPARGGQDRRPVPVVVDRLLPGRVGGAYVVGPTALGAYRPGRDPAVDGAVRARQAAEFALDVIADAHTL